MVTRTCRLSLHMMPGQDNLLTLCLLSCRSVTPTQLDASQEHIFREVIPDGSAKALSRYTDMVDALIREQNDRLAGASDDARLRLRERDLPDCLQVLFAFTKICPMVRVDGEHAPALS